MKVINKTLTGTIINPGPYGDYAYQVLDENGNYHTVDNDLKNPFNNEQWEFIKENE